MNQTSKTRFADASLNIRTSASTALRSIPQGVRKNTRKKTWPASQQRPPGTRHHPLQQCQDNPKRSMPRSARSTTNKEQGKQFCSQTHFLSSPQTPARTPSALAFRGMVPRRGSPALAKGFASVKCEPPNRRFCRRVRAFGFPAERSRGAQSRLRGFASVMRASKTPAGAFPRLWLSAAAAATGHSALRRWRAGASSQEYLR